MALTSRELQFLCMVCFIQTSECLNITYSGTFEINTEVKFTCVHDSYTGSHRWKVDTAEVLICISTVCVANGSNPARFSFVSDPGNGVFVFTINPVLRSDDDSIIGCHDGTVEKTVRLEVREPGDSQIITTEAIVGICFGVIVFIALVVCCCFCCVCKLTPPKMFESNDIKDDTVSVSWKAGCRLAWFHLSYEDENLTVCRRHNTIRDLKPLTDYDITLYATTMCRKSNVRLLHVKTHGKPNPPKKFEFIEITNIDEMSYVSWEQGFNGGCDQTFILRFEKILIKTHSQTDTARDKPTVYKEDFHDQEITNTTAAELNKPKIVEGHAEILDVESDKKFEIPSNNVTTTIRMLVIGLEPSSQYEIKLCGKNKYGESEVKTLHEKTHDKPDPPEDFMFNENISSYELPYVSWVPGFNRGCPQTFILQFETPNQTNTRRGKPAVYKENFHDQEITNTTAAEINKPKIDEGHAEILDVESNNIFAITSNNVTTPIRRQIKGIEPSSQYDIKLCAKNKYGESEVKTLHEKTHDKPDPPTDFMFNENISSFELPYVSWVPGFDGGCPQTFFLQFETPNQTNTRRVKPMISKGNFHDQENTNTTAAEPKKKKFVVGHSMKLDVDSYNIFVIPSHNVTTTIRMQIIGIEPSSQYEIKLCAKNKYGESEVKTLNEITHGKPHPPKKFKFNENTNNDEMSYVSWEPGFNGGCDQTFILRFEQILIKTDNQTDTARGKPMSIKKIKFVEGHHEILDVKSNNTFAITSPKEAKEILLQIKGREPSSTYKIMLSSENEYGESKVMTLYANETTILSHRSDHSDQQEQEMKVQLDGIVVEVADGASLRPGHTNQPKHDKTLQRHGLSVEESNGSDPLQPPI